MPEEFFSKDFGVFEFLETGDGFAPGDFAVSATPFRDVDAPDDPFVFGWISGGWRRFVGCE